MSLSIRVDVEDNCINYPNPTPVAEWLKAHLNIRSSHRCIWFGFESQSGAETSQVFIGGVPCGYYLGSVFAPPPDCPAYKS